MANYSSNYEDKEDDIRERLEKELKDLDDMLTGLFSNPPSRRSSRDTRLRGVAGPLDWRKKMAEPKINPSERTREELEEEGITGSSMELDDGSIEVIFF